MQRAAGAALTAGSSAGEDERATSADGPTGPACLSTGQDLLLALILTTLSIRKYHCIQLLLMLTLPSIMQFA